MASKSFRVAVQTEKIEFTLEYLRAGKPASQTFHCRPTVPVGLILQFASAGGPQDEKDKDGGKFMELIQDLYKAAVVPEEYPVFEELLNDPDAGIDIELYSEIAGWLAGEYTARPTGENSESSQPASLSGTDSTGGASVIPLTYSRSEPAEVSQ